VIRELTAADRAALAFIFGRLGAESRYQRFLTAKRELDAPELDFLTAVDHWHHEALIAFSPAPRMPVAVARYVRTADFDGAEPAIAVADAWQRRGIGAELMLALRERALRAGIATFSATLLRSNGGALAVARLAGPVTVIRAEGDVLEVLVRLAARRCRAAAVATAAPRPAGTSRA
jgi:GNAT superfamily N-acetyltransferase